MMEELEAMLRAELAGREKNAAAVLESVARHQYRS
jgi:hypothetical protein